MNGCYQPLNDFIEGISLGIEQLNILIGISDFCFSDKNKAEAFGMYVIEAICCKNIGIETVLKSEMR